MTRRRSYDVAFYMPSIGPLLTTRHVIPTGGAETQIYLLARTLARRGVRVCLLTCALPVGGVPDVVDGVDVVLRHPYEGNRRITGKIRETRHIRRTLTTVDAGTVVGRTVGPEVGLVALFSKLAVRRYVYSSSSDGEFSKLMTKRRDRVLFWLGMKLADEVVVQTAEQARLYAERFGLNPLLIRSIAEPVSRPSVAPEAFLWIGRVISYKQPLAFVELARRIPEAQFRIVAVPSSAPEAPTLMTALEQAAAVLPNLEVVSPRRRSGLMEIVDRAIAIVNTSDFEGMPNTFLEGWSRGVPALALTHDPDHVIERHGLGGFGNGDPERFAALARRLWVDRPFHRSAAERARRYVADYHAPDVVAAQWEHALGLSSDGAEVQRFTPGAAR